MKLYAALCTVFSVSLVVADLVAPRLTTIGPFTFTSGMVAFPVTFILTDLVHELWGAKAARDMTWMGLGASLLSLGIVAIALQLPAAPVGLPPEVFAQAFGGSALVITASLSAYVVSQLLDIAVFSIVSRYGFLARATVSTFLSQAVDTLVFVAIAFGWLGWQVASGVAVSLYVAKAIAALLAVPVLALTRRLIRGANPLAHGSLQ